MILQLSLPKLGGGQVTFNYPTGSKFNTPADIINEVLKYIFPISGLILFFIIIAAGFILLTSAGNEEKNKKAGAMLTSAVIGFAILFTSFWIMKLLQFVFGFKVL